ncbi:hypothetical protein MKW98_024167 [Papaver atlanticum]|uniref:Uncharacterized protein n=1 Tax=Papaver atlanticum TaxID=357466 RepID=A0AAD4XNT2_9MAGN|nr:hypothetical protein MKW98_024167 [Papaver atlanticum]
MLSKSRGLESVAGYCNEYLNRGGDLSFIVCGISIGNKCMKLVWELAYVGETRETQGLSLLATPLSKWCVYWTSQSLGFNFIGFYQMTKLSMIPFTVLFVNLTR